MITIPLEVHTKTPMYIQIYEYIKKEILGSHLQAGEKLPSARSLANNLQVSRSTVDTAYEQLVAEGYVEARPKRGFFINSITHLQQFTITGQRDQEPPKQFVKEVSIRYDFNPDAIDTEHFPYSVWKSLGKNQLDIPDNFLSGDRKGDRPLRQAIANYLLGSRGVRCTPDQIIIGAGLSHLLQMLGVLFERHATIAMEDPGYRTARQVLVSSGYTILDIPLRESALDIQKLTRSGADICFVTPSHQFPLGSVMPISRRQALLAWAAGNEKRYIIEDDHDSEFRYKGKPIPALQSLDTAGKVIYIGTFSKAISPAIRMGYMVLPPHLITRYQEKCGSYSCPVSRIEQAILTDFIQQGYFEKHLNRMRKIYKGKHDRILQCVQQHFPSDLVEISGDHAGLYVLLRYHGLLSEEYIESEARKNGIELRSLKGYYSRLPADYLPTYLLGFANLNEEKIDEGIQCLAAKVFHVREPYPAVSESEAPLGNQTSSLVADNP